MATIIKLREKIGEKIENGKVKNINHLSRLSRQYHRIRLWEATVITHEGGRKMSTEILSKQPVPIKVFPHMKFVGLDVEDRKLISIICEDSREKEIAFLLAGEKNVEIFTKNFKPGNYINVVCEGRMVRKISKGIDVEV